MDSEAGFHNQTEQLIASMMSFLDETDEHVQAQKTEEDKNTLCWAIKQIINVLPEQQTSNEFHIFKQQSNPLDNFQPNQMRRGQIETACRYKDPYMQEVNRLMSSSSMGHPPEGSAEYYQAAENYAIFGKEFLDFPTELKFSYPLDIGSFGDMSAMPTSLVKLPPAPMFGMQAANRTKPLTTQLAQQQQIFVNQTNYCSYPLVQSQNFVPPLIYSNPFLMNQYFSAIMKESQVNASLAQQQLLNGAGFHERWLYAQMLQQQMQANQTALSCYLGGGTGNNAGKSRHELVKTGTATHASDAGAPKSKLKFDDGSICDSSTVE